MSLMWISAADDPSTLSHRAERLRDQSTDGSEDDRRVESYGRYVVGTSSPTCAQRERMFLGWPVTGTGKGIDLAALPIADLRQNVGSGAKTIKSDAAPIARLAQRAPADQTRTH